MFGLNMKERLIERQTKLVFNIYRDSPKEVIDSKIENGLLGSNNHLQTLKPNALAFRPEKVILLLSELHGNSSRITSSKKNNSRPLLTRN